MGLNKPTESETNMSNNDNSITLDTPIKRSSGDIAALSLRKPNSGELRGTNLTDLLQMDVIALQTILPRITEPTITTQEVALMDPADLMQCGTKVAVFLLPKGAMPTAFQKE